MDLRWSAACLALCGVHAVAATAVVTLRGQAEVPGRVFALADVARVECADPQAAQALGALTVARIGSPAGRGVYQRDTLERHVARHLPPGVHRVQWRGAEAVEVRLALEPLEPRIVVERAAAALREALEPFHHDVEVSLASRPGVVRLPAGDHTLHARLPAGAHTRPTQRMRVDVDVRSQGQVLAVLPVWFDVRAHAPRWVPRYDLPAGHVLRPDDLERRHVNVAGLRSEPGNPAGLRLRRPARAGEPLPTLILEDVPWVRSQAQVIVQVRRGAVAAESRGIALADGRAGDWIPVRVPGAAPLKARVVAPGRLALEDLG